MKRFDTRRALVLGILAAAAAAPACGRQADKPVRIGFSMARTGILAVATPPQMNTYELWRDEVNAAGGLNVGGTKRKVEFVSYDDQSKPEQAVRIYEKLITDDKVDLLLAPWGTPFHIAIAPVLEKYKFPVVGNTAASVALRQVKPGYIWFPTSAIPDRIAVELTAMMKGADVKSAAIVSNVLPFSKEIKNFLEPELKKAGIEVKVSTEYPPDVKDMTATLTQIKQANVDAVLALAYPGDAVLYAKQAKELGIAAPFEFIAIGPTNAFFPKAVGASSAEDIVTIAHWSPRPDWKGSQAFYDAYVEEVRRSARLPRLVAAVDVPRDPADRGGQGRPRQGEDPRDRQHGDLRHHQRQGEVRRRAERRSRRPPSCRCRRASCRSSGRSRSRPRPTSRRRAGEAGAARPGR